MSIDTKLTEYLKIKNEFQKNPENVIFKLKELLKEVEKEIRSFDVKHSEYMQDLRERMEEINEVAEAKQERGDIGEKGDKGDKGEQGERGPAGLRGDRGETGEQGEKGKDGKNGRDGKDGRNGIDGKNGKDGSPDEPKQIVKKLNTLEEVVEQKVIKGLAEKFEEFKVAIKNIRMRKSGGGGMGNIITETPSGDVNGVNTTFTLTSNVKSNSLILLWNGQFQRAGASYEYTLSGKTITFNAGSVPTAGELFAWYIRS